MWRRRDDVTLFSAADASVLGLDHPATTSGWGAHILVFVKMLAFMVLFIWVRWMFPRFRYDQLMDLAGGGFSAGVGQHFGDAIWMC